MTLGPLPFSSEINLLTSLAYLPYLVMFFNSEHKNEEYELIARRADLFWYYLRKRLTHHLVIIVTILFC